MCRKFSMKLAAMAAALALTLSAAGASRAADQTPFEINTIVSTDGPGRVHRSGDRHAFKVVESVVNRQGGINGRPVKFIYNDDASNPQVAVQIIGRLVALHPPAILGPGFGATCAAVLPLVSQNGPVTWCLSPTAAGPPGSYMFGTGASTTDASRAPHALLPRTRVEADRHPRGHGCERSGLRDRRAHLSKLSRGQGAGRGRRWST